MSEWVFAENRLGLPGVGDVVATTGIGVLQHLPALGTIVQAQHPTYGQGEFIFLQGLASTAVGEVVVYNPDDYSTKLAVANDIGPVAVATAATVADTYGWYQIGGKGVALVATGFADNADCYLTATPGTIDDADVAGDYIRGMKGASAIGTPSAGLAEVEMWRPSVANGLDN